HFRNLTMLLFAAKARVPHYGGAPCEVYAEHLRDLAMAIFGLSHTLNTNNFRHGVSGGKGKRVSI
ncbi:hypothetical protein DFH07DRAFT_710039, partial [Mycena maculata]